MYDYRKLTPSERVDLVFQRMSRGFPAHEPPHIYDGYAQFMITGTCFEHAHILGAGPRLAEFRDELLPTASVASQGFIHAWVILPNHFHMLWEGELALLKQQLQLLYGRTSYRWNLEDNQAERRVWYRFTDRIIRSPAHYYATVNYIHGNPVKHRWAKRADEWHVTSLHAWLQRLGRDRLVGLWQTYPVDRYGEGWDE